jgi:hypothetical protein
LTKNEPLIAVEDFVQIKPKEVRKASFAKFEPEVTSTTEDEKDFPNLSCVLGVDLATQKMKD